MKIKATPTHTNTHVPISKPITHDKRYAASNLEVIILEYGVQKKNVKI
jgi:hypothetical protein